MAGTGRRRRSRARPGRGVPRSRLVAAGVRRGRDDPVDPAGEEHAQLAPRRFRRRPLVLPVPRAVDCALPGTRALDRAVGARSALLRARQPADHAGIPLGSRRLADETRAAGPYSCRRGRAVDPARVRGGQLAVRRVLVGPRRRITVAEPVRSTRRVVRDVRTDLRDRVAGGARHRMRFRTRGPPGVAGLDRRRRDRTGAGHPGVAGNDPRDDQDRRGAGQRTCRLLRRRGARRGDADTGGRHRKDHRRQSRHGRLAGRLGRHRSDTRPGLCEHDRRPGDPDERTLRRRDDHLPQQGVLQHVAPVGAGQRRHRLLRQEAPRAVRRVRTGPSVLADVRTEPDRPDRPRLHSGHPGQRVRHQRCEGGNLDLFRHRRRPAPHRHDERRRAGHPGPDQQRGFRANG